MQNVWLLLQNDVLQISRLREPQPTRVGFSPFGGGAGGRKIIIEM